MSSKKKLVSLRKKKIPVEKTFILTEDVRPQSPKKVSFDDKFPVNEDIVLHSFDTEAKETPVIESSEAVAIEVNEFNKSIRQLMISRNDIYKNEEIVFTNTETTQQQDSNTRVAQEITTDDRNFRVVKPSRTSHPINRRSSIYISKNRTM